MSKVVEVTVKFVVEQLPESVGPKPERMVESLWGPDESGLTHDWLACAEITSVSEPRDATDEECEALIGRMTEDDGIVLYDGDESKLTTCKKCGCYVYPPYGADAPAIHAGNAGSKNDPRAPGDQDNICDECCYAEDKSPL